MSFRRFVYLVTDDYKRRTFLLRHIDMSRFFFPAAEKARLLADPPSIEEGRLPPPAIRFDSPIRNIGAGSMDFMFFAGGGDGCRKHNPKVVATDFTGCALFYDPNAPSVGTYPCLTEPKSAPVSLTVGDSFYILDTESSFEKYGRHCFEFFRYHDCDGWSCYSLHPPPFVNNNTYHVDAYTVVGGSRIWISESITSGTYCFDTASCVWTRAGDWVLPFFGHVQYVPEHKLWFGLSSDGSSICASDLTVSPPTARSLWRDFTSPRWTSKSSYLVHLGGSRFCHARFYQVNHSDELYDRSYVVLTGIEVENGREAVAEVFVVKHRSEQFRLSDSKVLHWVL